MSFAVQVKVWRARFVWTSMPGRGDGVGEAVDMVAGALPDAWRRSSRGWAASTRSSAVGSELCTFVIVDGNSVTHDRIT